MVKEIAIGTILAMMTFLGSAGQSPALACTATNGCVITTFRDDYNMMRDGRMEKAMAAGRENVEAFRALQHAQHEAPARGR